MIIGTDTNPKNQIYYIGGLILDILKRETSKSFSYDDVFELLNRKQKVSINLYTLSLDWLYMLKTISLNNKGLVKCF